MVLLSCSGTGGGIRVVAFSMTSPRTAGVDYAIAHQMQPLGGDIQRTGPR
jgi:hypothetical protein